MQQLRGKCLNTERMVGELSEILQQWHPQGGGNLQLLVPKPDHPQREQSQLLVLRLTESSSTCTVPAQSLFSREEERVSSLPKPQASGNTGNWRP